MLKALLGRFWRDERGGAEAVWVALVVIILLVFVYPYVKNAGNSAGQTFNKSSTCIQNPQAAGC